MAKHGLSVPDEELPIGNLRFVRQIPLAHGRWAEVYLPVDATPTDCDLILAPVMRRKNFLQHCQDWHRKAEGASD